MPCRYLYQHQHEHGYLCDSRRVTRTFISHQFITLLQAVGPSLVETKQPRRYHRAQTSELGASASASAWLLESLGGEYDGLGSRIGDNNLTTEPSYLTYIHARIQSSQIFIVLYYTSVSRAQLPMKFIRH